MAKLLKEDGGAILKEDGGAILLLPLVLRAYRVLKLALVNALRL